MQIRLTVVDPQGTRPESQGRAAARDVLVTAPSGTALATVASGLAAAGDRGEGPVVLYAGPERLDAQRCVLGEPPLTDGAVLSLGAPADPGPDLAGAAAQLHVVAGPDAGGVHLLHGGQIRVGRSADADVPLDDPDVSRLHCAVTVSADGRVTVTDLGSTNGTAIDGTPIADRPVRLAPGALLRVGESTLCLTPPGATTPPLPTAPDGEGHVRVGLGGAPGAPEEPGAAQGPGMPQGPGAAGAVGGPAGVHDAGRPGAAGGTRGAGAVGTGRTPGPTGRPGTAVLGVELSGAPQAPYGSRGTGPDGAARARSEGASPGGLARAGEPSPSGGFSGPRDQGLIPGGGHPGGMGPVGDTHHAYGAAGRDADGTESVRGHERDVRAEVDAPVVPEQGGTGPVVPEQGGAPDAERTRVGTPPRGTTVPRGVRKRGGLSAWARRLAGGRGDHERGGAAYYGDEPAARESPTAQGRAPQVWPDPAALLLTALGPGPRLWERGPGHPEALAVRLGTTERPAPDGSGLLPAVPVTVGLREAGALGLAGPRSRLTGLARSVVAQLAALHAPDTLEIVLISTDRSRTAEERTAEWSWLGWLPHLRPAHGQDCRLLLAYDREQATSRTDELLRRLEDRLADAPGRSPLPGGRGPAETHRHRGTGPDTHGSPAPEGSTGPGIPATGSAVPSSPTDTPAPTPDAHTVVVVDGDPGSAVLREAVARLCAEGPLAGIHVVCLAETPAASPASPLVETYEAACAVSPAFRACGAVALLSGDVATALRLLRTAQGSIAGHGTVATVDAVSAAWAERFARALAPLRTEGGPGDRHARVSAPLPQAARLLDELGLARATPASLMARWAAAADDTEALGGRAWAVLGAGPRGPVCVDLAAEGPHLLVGGPAGSGRTELLRSVAASLAAAERPDRLGIVLIDGRDSAGGTTSGGVVAGGGGSERGDGLRVCTDLPHVTTYLTANDPVRMREFAQSLAAELKRRAELLGRLAFAEWHTQREVSGRIIGQRTPHRAAGSPAVGGSPSAADLDTPPSSTLRLRPPASRSRPEPGPPLPRLVVVVDDVDALLAPPLGSPGRPAAGSVVRALEAVARDGERLGVHLVAATGRGGRTEESELARRAALRVELDAVSAGPEDPAPGRGRVGGAHGRVTPFQAGRVTGRIPRTATLRPTVVGLDWERMGDPPARRPVRELGNGPTDLALLASALERAAKSVAVAGVPSLL